MKTPLPEKTKLTEQQRLLIWQTALHYTRAYGSFWVGLVVAIGSTGLVLGGFTVAVAYLLIRSDINLIVALMAGFFAVGLAGLFAGGMLIAVGAAKFKP